MQYDNDVNRENRSTRDETKWLISDFRICVQRKGRSGRDFERSGRDEGECLCPVICLSISLSQIQRDVMIAHIHWKTRS